jgi:ubiquinone/menaquinone biosynthesis C-methylase UbiE
VDTPMEDSHFRTMCLMYKFRDFFLPRKKILRELDIKPGFQILDFGCGPGSYSMVAARLVGDSGKVFALDIHPSAIQRIEKLASRKRLTNIETIQSDCATGLKDESIDVAFLYDILHHLSEPNAVLGELHRVLKPDGILSVNDHHLTEEEILFRITTVGLFGVSKKGLRVYNFTKLQGGKT